MSSDVEICGTCKDNFIVNSKSIKCGLCQAKYHGVCVSIRDSWLKFVSECANLAWFCNNCNNNWQHKIKSKGVDRSLLEKEIECLRREKHLTDKLLSELEYTVSLQKSTIAKYEGVPDDHTNHSAQTSATKYSDVVKSGDVTSSVLIIERKDGTVPENDILKDITTSVNLADINACINATKKIRRGVAVHCEDDRSLNALKESLNGKLSSKYQIKEAIKYNPRLLINNVRLEGLDTPKQIVDNIIALNNIPEEDASEIKLVTKLVKNQYTNIVIEVSPILRKVLLQKGSVFVGWKKSVISDYIRVVRCYKCCGFGHYSKDCKELNSSCSKCSGTHCFKDCKSESNQCVNCTKQNKFYKKNFPIDHASGDPACPSLLAYTFNIKSKINYAT